MPPLPDALSEPLKIIRVSSSAASSKNESKAFKSGQKKKAAVRFKKSITLLKKSINPPIRKNFKSPTWVDTPIPKEFRRLGDERDIDPERFFVCN
jgi:hypothetical protein